MHKALLHWVPKDGTQEEQNLIFQIQGRNVRYTTALLFEI